MTHDMMTKMDWDGVAHWSVLTKCLQEIHIYFGRNVIIWFYSKNWILPSVHIHNGIKHRIIFPGFNASQSSLPHWWITRIGTCGKWNNSFCITEMYLLNEVLLLMFIVTQNILVCVLCQSYQSSSLWNTKMMFFFRGMDCWKCG